MVTDLILKNHPIRKKTKYLEIRIRKDGQDQFKKHVGEDVILFIGHEKPINTQITYSKPRYKLTIPDKHTRIFEKYLDSVIGVTVRITSTIEK